MELKRIGVIGTGRIGNPMAKNLVKAGYQVTAQDIRPDACLNLPELGVQVVSTPKEVAAASDVIILSLMRAEIIEEVLFGSGGACEADLRGKYIIDTSTSLPHKTREFSARLEQLGAALVDAPLTGGESGAQAATLIFFVGGKEEAFQAVKPVLEALSSKAYYFGESGSGHVVKLAHQMMMTAMFVSIAEAFAFVEKMGLDGYQVFQAVERGGPASGILSGFGGAYQRDLSGDPLPDDAHYPPVFAKDVHYALQEGYVNNCYMPVAAVTEEAFKQALGAKMQGGTPILKLLEYWRSLDR